MFRILRVQEQTNMFIFKIKLSRYLFMIVKT